MCIGTVYRYFPDREVIVEELLARIQGNIERRFTQRVQDMSDTPVQQPIAGIPEVVMEEMAADVPLVRAMIAALGFYSSGMPELETRLRMLVKVLIIQIHGPGDEYACDVLTFTVLSAGFG
ncbi:TetR/AcrR family transcriptional regulator [Nocardia goodfellowii]